MIKEVFELNKNSWYVKMVEYTWNLSYKDFSHICPLFWLSIVSLVIFPFKFLFKEVFGTIINWIFDPILKWWNNLPQYIADKEQKENEKLKTLLSDPVKWKEYCDKYLKCKKNMFTDLWYNNIINYDQYKEISTLRTSYLNSLPIIQQKKKETNKERINRIVKVVKPFSKILLTIGSVIGGIAALWFTYYAINRIINSDFIYWFIMRTIATLSKITLASLYQTLLIIAAVIFTIIGLFLISHGISELYQKYFKCCTIFNPFKWIWNGLSLFFTVIVQIIKNNCPAIEWKEDNK
jgi:hypothetical protein